jgi:glycosyltransferase involved in cell wall biosynthesis
MHRGRLRRASFTPYPERYMAAADIFCLPSYREGFGQVIIEAAACGVPAVATRIYGITDAVEDGKTGLLFTPGDVDRLAEMLLKLVEDKVLRQRMAEHGMARTLELFDSRKVTAQLIDLFDKSLAETKLRGKPN